MKLIENWTCHLWRAWSVRLNAIGLALLGWIQIDPAGVLSVWNMMPGPIHETLPRGLVAGVGALFFALSMLSRVVRQPKMQARIEEKRSGK